MTQGEVPGTPLPRGENQNQGESVSPSSSPSTPTPVSGYIINQSQSQVSTNISQQLPYEETGSTVVMVQGSNGQQMPMISGGKGTPIIMGSGDVVNSYYKSQVLELII